MLWGALGSQALGVIGKVSADRDGALSGWGLGEEVYTGTV